MTQQHQDNHRQRTEEQILAGLEPIVAMEASPCYENKLEAARMLYDISQLDPLLICSERVMDKVVSLLTKLILCPDGKQFPDIVEQAICSFAAFCAHPSYQMKMIYSKALFVIVSFVSNPIDRKTAFQTAQLRRECAQILVLLVRANVQVIIDRLEQEGKMLVGEWAHNLDAIEDSRMQIHTKKIQSLLSKRLLMMK
jgi:hypothetical protein